MNEEKRNEYLMLREEINLRLSYQQKYSTFAITATITIIGFALQTSNSVVELYLLPYIVLFLSSVKVSNYKAGIEKAVGYMIAKLENPNGFYWETSLNEFRKYSENNDNKMIVKLREILETQEFSFMALICFVLYNVMILRVQPHYYFQRIILFDIIAFLTIICMVIISMNYWNFNPKVVNNHVNIWKDILNDEQPRDSSTISSASAHTEDLQS